MEASHLERPALCFEGWNFEGGQPECQDGRRLEIEFIQMAPDLNQLDLHSDPDQNSGH